MRALVYWWPVVLAIARPTPAWATEPVTLVQHAVGPKTIEKLGDEYLEWMLSHDPLSATYLKHRGYDDKLADVTPEGRAKKMAEGGDLLKRVKSVEPAGLPEADRASWEILKLQLELELERERHKIWQWEAILPNVGPDSFLCQVVALAQPMASEQDAERLLARMRAFGPYLDAQTVNLREGMREGRVAARVLVESTIAAIKDRLAQPELHAAFGEAGRRLPLNLQEKYLPLILREANATPRASLEKYLRFLDADYLKASRDQNVGLRYIRGGAEAYRFHIRLYTSLDKTPEEVHRMGLEELASIHAEMKVIADRAGHRGPPSQYLEKVRSDHPTNYFETRQEVLAAAQEQVTLAYKRLPQFFGVLPKTPLEVQPFPDYQEDRGVAAFYFVPPEDLSRPGIFYINTYEPAIRPRFGMAALVAHKGLLGAHIQSALNLEDRSLPLFRRQTGFMAFSDGWALYAVRLADEMGLYMDDLSRLGMLSVQAFWAARMVVDTGIHAKGWSRSKAIQFMKSNSPESEQEIVTAVDESIYLPGWAVASKIGQLEITRLRREAQTRQGNIFDIKAFHGVVLRNGAVPLPTLARIVTAALTPNSRE